MEKQLPKNWVETSPIQISRIIRGVSYGKQDAFQEEFEDCCLILRGGNIQEGDIVDGKDNVYVAQRLIKKEQLLQKHDVIIVGSTGSKNLIGKAATAQYDSNKISFGAFLMNIRAFEQINKRYFSYYFQTNYYREAIRNLAGGVNINNIRKEYIENLYFPLPPLAEQNRIVAKLDTLFVQLEIIKTSMEKIPVLLKDFRQQVLTQAVTGRLTEELRKGKKLNKWNYKKIEKLTLKVGSGSTPTGGQAAYLSSGIPLIRSMNVHFHGIKYDGMAYLNESQAKGLKNVEVFENDILLNITGASIGRVCLAPKEIAGGRVNQHVCIIRPNDEIKSSFLNIYLSSPIIQNLINNENYGVTRQSFTKAQILTLEIPIPHLDEQQIILLKVESLFAKADAIEKQYLTLKEKIDNLPRAILHKAFKGELTEHLDSDGDARDLLKEIEVLKASTTKVKNVGKVEEKKMTMKKVKTHK